jgi:hypothetical protein
MMSYYDGFEEREGKLGNDIGLTEWQKFLQENMTNNFNNFSQQRSNCWIFSGAFSAFFITCVSIICSNRSDIPALVIGTLFIPPTITLILFWWAFQDILKSHKSAIEYYKSIFDSANYTKEKDDENDKIQNRIMKSVGIKEKIAYGFLAIQALILMAYPIIKKILDP